MKSSLPLILLLAATTIPITVVSAATTPAPCTQGNALSVLVSSTSTVTANRTETAASGTATAYLPNGSWDYGTTGIRVVSLEGSAAPSLIPTPGVVDSCASDSVSQQVVCIDVNKVFYLIAGTKAQRYTTKGHGDLNFSGGGCTNCSVAIDVITHTAYIEEAITNKDGTFPAIQAFDMTTKSFLPPFRLKNGSSESIVVDPNNNLILAANEGSDASTTEIYDIITLDPDTGALKSEYGNVKEKNTAEYDSSGEDCTTGIILGTDEFTGDLFMANLSKTTFLGHTWKSTQERLFNFPQFNAISAGTTALSVAPGTHYAIMAGEFGGNVEGFIQLPATANITNTGLKDYVIATMPNDPLGDTFQNGYDPHSVTSYTSPNDGKAYAVLADWSTGAPEYVAVVDIAAMMAAPRILGDYTNGKHVVNPSYDLIAHGVVRFVKTD